MSIQSIKETVNQMKTNIETVILGKDEQIILVITALLSGGHVLLEDVPGTGKTVLAKSLAKSVDCQFGRVQFTPDLLPSELSGINFYNPKSGEFTFRQGSLFANIVLADEINRATPRTQSGLLESMEEHQVTVDGVTHILEPPYFVIATQNPIETQGTFPLPEAQLDRFLIQLSLGYPAKEETVNILKRFAGEAVDNPIDLLQPVCTVADIIAMQNEIKSVYIQDDVSRYIVELAEKSRDHESVVLGVSTRGCLALAKMAKAYAAITGLDYVTPDMVKYLMPYVFSHRILLRGGLKNNTNKLTGIIKEIIDSTAVPTEDFKPNRR